MTKDFIDDDRDRCSGVDGDAVVGQALSCLMQLGDEFPFRWSSAPVVGVGEHAFVNPPVQGFEVDLKDENAVEQMDELGGVSSPAAEEGHRLILVCDEGFDFV